MIDSAVSRIMAQHYLFCEGRKTSVDFHRKNHKTILGKYLILLLAAEPGRTG
jgi:hypothetical protein